MAGLTVARQPFWAHLVELRRRLIWSTSALLAGGGAGYLWRNNLVAFLQHPLHQTLFYTSPAGAFNLYMKISFFFGLLVFVPVLLFNILKFIEPALPRKITFRLVLTVLVSSMLLFLGGAAFGYYVILPQALHFFGSFSSTGVKALITTDSYFSFVMGLLITFALIFQTPLLLLLINSFTPFGPSGLLKYQRMVIVGSFVLAVILPFTYDPLSQFLMAIPLVVLYYCSVILVWIVERRRLKRLAVQAQAPVYVARDEDDMRRRQSGWNPPPARAPRPVQPRAMQTDAIRRSAGSRAGVLDLSQMAPPEPVRRVPTTMLKQRPHQLG